MPLRQQGRQAVATATVDVEPEQAFAHQVLAGETHQGFPVQTLGDVAMAFLFRQPRPGHPVIGAALRFRQAFGLGQQALQGRPVVEVLRQLQGAGQARGSRLRCQLPISTCKACFGLLSRYRAINWSSSLLFRRMSRASMRS